MTLSSKICRVIHQIDPALTSYTFPFKIFKAHEAAVWILDPGGVEMVRLRMDGDYLVSGLESDSGGEIKLTESGLAQAAKGHGLLIIRNMDFTQDIDYRPHDIFPARSHERALDILTMQNQELLDMLKRAALIPIGRQGNDPWGEFAGLAGQAAEAAEAAESSSRGAADAGREAAAAAKAVIEAAQRAERISSLLNNHEADPDAHKILFGKQIRYCLTGDTTFYVRPDGNDLNDGSADTPASALKSIAGAVGLLRRTDQRGYNAIISLAPGTWPQISIYGKDLSGVCGITSTDLGNPAVVQGITAWNGAILATGNLTVTGALDLLSAYGGVLQIAGPLTFKGSRTHRSCMLAQAMGRIYIPFGKNTSIYYDNVACQRNVWSTQAGEIQIGNAVFRAGDIVTGARYLADAAGYIGTMLKGPGFIPGTIAGFTDAATGGVYA